MTDHFHPTTTTELVEALRECLISAVRRYDEAVLAEIGDSEGAFVLGSPEALPARTRVLGASRSRTGDPMTECTYPTCKNRARFTVTATGYPMPQATPCLDHLAGALALDMISAGSTRSWTVAALDG